MTNHRRQPPFWAFATLDDFLIAHLVAEEAGLFDGTSTPLEPASQDHQADCCSSSDGGDWDGDDAESACENECAPVNASRGEWYGRRRVSK